MADRVDANGPTTDDERPTMADVSHTHPYTGESLGELFQRGPAVADGGKRRENDAADDDEDRPTMADVDHTPPDRNVNDVWARGKRPAADADADAEPEVEEPAE